MFELFFTCHSFHSPTPIVIIRNVVVKILEMNDNSEVILFRKWGVSMLKGIKFKNIFFIMLGAAIFSFGFVHFNIQNNWRRQLAGLH